MLRVAGGEAHPRAVAERNGGSVHHLSLPNCDGAVAASPGKGDTSRRVRRDCIMILDTGFGHRGLEEMTIAIGFIDAPRLPDLSDLEPAKDVGHQLQMILVRIDRKSTRLNSSH